MFVIRAACLCDTYLLDDGRDVAGVLLHGLGVLVVLEGRHGGAARSPAPRSHTLICRAALLCLKGAGLCFALVEAGRPPPSEPSVYHSRGSRAPQILVALRGSPSSLFPTREKAAHLPGGASARPGGTRKNGEGTRRRGAAARG